MVWGLSRIQDPGSMHTTLGGGCFVGEGCGWWSGACGWWLWVDVDPARRWGTAAEPRVEEWCPA